MSASAYGVAEASGIWVFLEQDGGVLEGVSLELLGRGRELANQVGTILTAIVLGDRVSAAAETARALGADCVLVAEHSALATYTTDAYARVMTDLVLERKPDILLLGATPNGRDLAGRLAVRLRTGLTADCTWLDLEESTGILLGRTTGFGGGVYATITCRKHRPQMATVRPGIFRTPMPVEAAWGLIGAFPVHLARRDQRTIVEEHVRHERPGLTTAERLVVGGGGTGGDFASLRELADLIGAELGATRVAVDQGWIERERQIGQTGVVTRPKLALILGASGAMQFTVGIDAAECVVAINADRDAPIFEHADYCIADEIGVVLPPLIDRIRAEKGVHVP